MTFGRPLSFAGRLTLWALSQAVLTVAATALALRLLGRPLQALGTGLAVGLLVGLASLRLVLRPAHRALQALTDGIRSFRDGDFSLRLAPVRGDELGALIALYNQMADALREQRHDLYQRELFLDTALQGTPMAIAVTNAASRVVYSNRAARQLLGAGHRLEGRILGDLLATAPPGLKEGLESTSDALFTVGAEGEETYRAARRTFHIHTQPHTLLMVERLTPELRRQEVEVWKRAIRVLNHELNNSLAPIRSLAHSARHVVARREHLQRLDTIFDTIEERATHLAEFLEGYARFARLPRPVPEAVAWPEFLERAGRVCRFRLEGTPPAWPAWFDPSQIEQVLINLVKNAREAGSPEDEVIVSVHATVDHGVALRVSDRGRGMSEEVMRQALLPFYSTKPSGSGLGLALCSEILEAHGGRLRLQNRSGGGLVVTCWLPPSAGGQAERFSIARGRPRNPSR
jgi:nitrogen fixation/metabolism regulation signal transduction histidine kinase